MPISTGPKWSRWFLTDAGLQLRTEIMAEKGTIEFPRAAIGEGKPLSEEQIGAMTSLVSYREPAYPVRSFALACNTHGMVIKMDNDVEGAAFQDEVLVTEVGLYAKKAHTDTEILYGYCYALVGYAPMPAAADQHRMWNLVVNTKISRASGVTVTYDGSKVFLTFEEFEQALAAYYTRIEIDVLLSEKASISDLSDKDWTPLTLRSGFAGSMQYALDRFGYVWLEGQVLKGGSSVDFGDVFADIPVGLRPQSRASIPVTLVNGANPNNTFDMGVISIYADGSIKLGKPLAAVGITGGAPVVTNVSYKAVQ